MRLNRVAAALALVLVLTAVMLGVGSAVDRGEETAAVPSQAGYYAGADETVAYGSLQAAYEADPTFTSFTAYNTNETVGNINGADGIATGLTLTVYGTLTLDPGTTSFTTITVEAGAKLTSSGFTATNLTVGAGATFTVTGTLILTGTATSLNAAADSTVSIGTLSLGTSASTVSMNFNNGGSAYSPTKNYATVNTLSLDSGGGEYTISLTGLAEVNNIGMGSNIYTYLNT